MLLKTHAHIVCMRGREDRIFHTQLDGEWEVHMGPKLIIIDLCETGIEKYNIQSHN